jgi:hypothetical protein
MNTNAILHQPEIVSRDIGVLRPDLQKPQFNGDMLTG